MAQAIENQQETQKVGGRGLLMVWRRELEKKLRILIDTWPGKIRGLL